MVPFSTLQFIILLFSFLISISTLNSNLLSQRASSVYIHIPFCRRRCFYCDFPIKVLGENKIVHDRESELYKDLLLREIECVSKGSQYKIDHSNNVHTSLESIYFGGGTPSLMTSDCISQILYKLNIIYGIDEETEVTLEMDPGTFDFKKIQELRKAGINRISLGVQSFDNDILSKCGRAHTDADILKAIFNINRCGITNYSIDLISSLPYLKLEKWEETLKRALAVDPTHISIYDLQVEDKTAFGRWYQPGVFPLPSEEVSVQMYESAVCELTSHGFEHYEVSNYAKKSFRSKHNQKYWQCSPYYGFGLGAASFTNQIRYTRPKSMQSYTDWIEQIENDTYDSILLQSNSESFSEIDILDVIMLSLRTSDGLDLSYLAQNYGYEYCDKIVKAVQQFGDKVNFDLDTNSNISKLKLSDPKGFLISNEIISSIFAALS